MKCGPNLLAWGLSAVGAAHDRGRGGQDCRLLSSGSVYSQDAPDPDVGHVPTGEMLEYCPPSQRTWFSTPLIALHEWKSIEVPLYQRGTTAPADVIDAVARFDTDERMPF